jgi:hypothetical protein
MSHIRIDSQKALKKWSPVLENMGITDSDRWVGCQNTLNSTQSMRMPT